MAVGVPKAFYQLDGQTLIERAVDGLLDSGVVDTVVVAVPADRTDEARQILGHRAMIVAGGSNRTDTVNLALTVLSGTAEPEFVLVHDAARALTPPALVARVVEALRDGYAAVVPVLPLSDTIKAVDANGWSWARRNEPGCGPCRPHKGSLPTCCCGHISAAP